MSHRHELVRTEEILGTALLVSLLFLIMTWGARSFPGRPAIDAVAGTDMFWELHDRHFPEHYLQDGRVICDEAQAAKELESLGLKIER